jgi:hypothetical protein
MDTLLLIIGIFVGLSMLASILVFSALAVSSRSGELLDEPDYVSVSVVVEKSTAREKEYSRDTALA